MSLVESRVPRTALTEALTWVVTGLTLGVTAGSAMAGSAVDTWGAETAFAVPALSAALAGLLALAGLPLLRRVGDADPAGEAVVDPAADLEVAASGDVPAQPLPGLPSVGES
jgi:predicted MFS family arabinose efflux permease